MMKNWKGGLAALAVAALMMTGAASAGASEATAAPSNTTSSGLIAPEMVSTSSTGDYEWVCVLTTGNTYSMAQHEPLTNCQGSYLQRYLDGRQLATYRLAYGGGAVDTAAEGCLISIGSGVLGILSPALTMRWVFSVVVGGIGYYRDCLG